MIEFIRYNARWLLACILMYFSSCFGQTFFISLYASEIRSAFNLSHGEWGSIYALGTLLSALAMLLLGGIVDKIHLKKITIYIFALLSILCIFMTFNYSIWLLPVIIFGLRFCGQGMLFHIPAVAIGRWFGKNKGKATSISVIGFSIGEATFPIIFAFIITIAGWRISWLFAVLILIIVLPILIKLLNKDRAPKSNEEKKFDQVGLENKHWSRNEVLRHWLFWSVAIPLLVTPIFSTAFFFYQIHLIEIKKWSMVSYFAIFPFYTIASVSALLLSGWLIDKFGVSKILPFFLIPMAIGLMLFSFGDSYYIVFIGFIFLGTTQGTAMTIGGTFWPNYFGTKNLGSIRSLSTSSMVFGTALGPFIVGQILDYGISYNFILLTMGLLAVTSSISLFITMSKVPNLK
tara:strand:+ start:288 stop:1496 length:1209 start_codon:yes stop_codon:yes gene_type:complete